MNYCELVNGYFTGSSGDFTQRPSVGDWVQTDAPVSIPQDSLAFWSAGAQAWGFVLDMGQREWFGRKALTKGQFRDRFTSSEQILLDNFEHDDVLIALGKSALDMMQKAVCRSMRETRSDSASIDPSHPQTIAAIQYYAQIGLIDASRINVILEP